MELLIKIVSVVYYIYHRKQILELREFCKRFLNSNMTTVNVGRLCAEKAVKIFYKNIIKSHSQLESNLLPTYENELDHYDDLKKIIGEHKYISQSAYSIIEHKTNVLRIYRYVRECDDFEDFINQQHKFICEIFNDMENDLYRAFDKDEEEDVCSTPC